MALSNADFRSLLNQADASILAAAVAPRKKKQASSLDPEERAQRRQEKNQKRRERYLEILKRRQKHKEGQHKGKGKGEEEDDGSADGASAGTTAAGGMGGLSGGGGGGGGGPGGAGGDSAGIPMPVRYKDRAEERRKGKDEIYQQAAEELQEMKERSVEESKYLGGDLEHTHLVKGLDFALLSKVRNELEKEEQKRLQKQQEEEAERKRNREQRRLHIYTPFGRRLFHAFFDNLHPHQTRFQENLRRLEMTLISPSSGHSSGGGKSSLLLQDEEEEDFTPTFIFRGAESNPAVQAAKQKGGGGERDEEGSAAILLPKIARELREALEWHRENRKKKKNERVARRPGSLKAVRDVEEKAAAAAADLGKRPAPDDDDIFGGVGGFDAQQALAKAVEEKKREEALNPPPASTAAAAPEPAAEEDSRKAMEIIREEEGMEVDDEPEAGMDFGASLTEDRQHGVADVHHQGWDRGAVLFTMSKKPQRRTFQTTTEDQDRGLLSVFRRDDETMIKQRREVLSDQREKDPAFVSDTYAECYPGFGSEVAYLGYDSDEEGERKETARVDTGEYRIIHKDKNQQFKSKEEYEKYIGEIEFVPKAALQYGRRFAGDINANRKKRKMNVDQEWKKIEGMIKERKAGTLATNNGV